MFFEILSFDVLKFNILLKYLSIYDIYKIKQVNNMLNLLLDANSIKTNKYLNSYVMSGTENEENILSKNNLDSVTHVFIKNPSFYGHENGVWSHFVFPNQFYPRNINELILCNFNSVDISYYNNDHDYFDDDEACLTIDYKLKLLKLDNFNYNGDVCIRNSIDELIITNSKSSFEIYCTSCKQIKIDNVNHVDITQSINVNYLYILSSSVVIFDHKTNYRWNTQICIDISLVPNLKYLLCYGEIDLLMTNKSIFPKIDYLNLCSTKKYKHKNILRHISEMILNKDAIFIFRDSIQNKIDML